MNVVKRICNKVAVMEHGEVVESFPLEEIPKIQPKSAISKILFNESKSVSEETKEEGEFVYVG